jgi:hypothetical protein
VQKDKDHHSSLYDDAWMPNMLRITWNGIARRRSPASARSPMATPRPFGYPVRPPCPRTHHGVAHGRRGAYGAARGFSLPAPRPAAPRAAQPTAAGVTAR